MMTSHYANVTDSMGTTSQNTFGNDAGSDVIEEINMPLLIGMLSTFAVVGTLGNTLVLYGFYKMLRQNLTSTMFILTLSGTDLVTSVVIIPFTIYMESMTFYIESDLVCKLYHFFITSSIPFSIFIMVAIAVDRYLCICRPFLHIMNMRRVKVIVLLLMCVAVALGIMAGLFYGVYDLKDSYDVTGNGSETTSGAMVVNSTDVFFIFNSSSVTTDYDMFHTRPTNPSVSFHERPNIEGDFPTADPLTNYQVLFSNHSGLWTSHRPRNPDSWMLYDPNVTRKTQVYFLKQCDTNNLIFDKPFRTVYQKIYSALFLVAVIIVAILYSLIYRAVLKRRKKTQKIRSLTGVPLTACPTNGHIGHPRRDSVFALPMRRKSSIQCTIKGKQYSRKSEKVFLANLRTAITLFMVTIFFVIVFLPGWLMAFGAVPLNIYVFYLYFLHGVVNPFIYAFMNETFRRILHKVIHCQGGVDDGFSMAGMISQTTC